jgi:hypothetical protein
MKKMKSKVSKKVIPLGLSRREYGKATGLNTNTKEFNNAWYQYVRESEKSFQQESSSEEKPQQESKQERATILLEKFPRCILGFNRNYRNLNPDERVAQTELFQLSKTVSFPVQQEKKVVQQEKHSKYLPSRQECIDTLSSTDSITLSESIRELQEKLSEKIRRN